MVLMLFNNDKSILDYLFGDTCMVVFMVVIVLYFSLKFMKEITGVAPGQMWLATRRPPKWKDIEANAHPRLIDKWVRQAKDSWDRKSKYLCIMSLDHSYYPTSERNSIRMGKIRGAGFYQDYHLVVFRTPWRFKKMIFLAPPTSLISSSGAKYLVYEGTGLKASGFTDIEYPAPSKFSEYTNQSMYEWVRETYERELAEVKRTLMTALSADLEMRATYPSARDRRAIELGRELTERSQQRDLEQPREDENDGAFI